MDLSVPYMAVVGYHQSTQKGLLQMSIFEMLICNSPFIILLFRVDLIPSSSFYIIIYLKSIPIQSLKGP